MHLIQKRFKSSVYKMNIEEQKKLLAMKRTTRSQLREGDRSWEGRLWEIRQAMNKNLIRGRQSGTRWHNTPKSCHSTLQVNETLGRRRYQCLPMEISLTCASCQRRASAVATRGMTREKSAEAIIAGIKRVGGLENRPHKQRDPWSHNPVKG